MIDFSYSAMEEPASKVRQISYILFSAFRLGGGGVLLQDFSNRKAVPATYAGPTRGRESQYKVPGSGGLEGDHQAAKSPFSPCINAGAAIPTYPS